MPLGERVLEEKGTLTGVSIKSVAADGMSIELNFAGEAQGFGRFPSGRILGTMNELEGLNTNRITGQGMFVTKEGESLPWNGSGASKSVGDKSKGMFLVTFNTSSQKYAWTNNLLLVLDMEVSADMKFVATGYEWM
jgi:hypothetical protein